MDIKQRRAALVRIAFVVLLCPLMSKSEQSNGHNAPSNYDDIASIDIGYDFLHAYRTALRNGLRGIKVTKGLNSTSACQGDVLKLLSNLELLIQYFDAVGKPRSGYLRGNIVWLGSYGECRDIPNAHYCTTQLTITVPESKNPKLNDLGALWGLCFPETCTGADVDFFLKKFILPEVKALTKSKIVVKNKDTMCPAVSPSYTTGVKVTLALCGFLLLLSLIGTVVDVLDDSFKISTVPADVSHYMTKDNHISFAETVVETDGGDSKNDSLIVDDIVLLNHSYIPVKVHYMVATFKASYLGRFFQCFSVIQNTAKIMKTDVTPSAIKSINGIRVLSITWVILGHTFGSAATLTVENRAAAAKDGQLLAMMAVLSADYSVDTFFFLSGLLVAYTCFRKLRINDRKFSWVLFYVHRFWRLTPSYMFVILFSIHLKGFLTESPFWYDLYTDPLCSKYWWTNLLYINNFYPKTRETCINWTWYLANDMQFFIITPSLIIPLFKVGWRGLVLPLGLLLEASVITAFIHAHWNLDPLSLAKVYKFFLEPDPAALKSLNEYMKYVYFKPYCRIQVYLVGFLLGYVMYRYKNTKKRTPGWITTLIGWSAAAVLAMLLVYGPHKSILPGAKEWSGAEKVLFGTFHRFLWGLFLVWVTYACHYGAGGLVQKFLSARFWIPLSRLTYNVYLIHYIILILMFYGAQGAIHYDLYTFSYYYLAAVILSYGAAYILSVIIEFPFANLEELILKCLRKAR